MAQAGSAFLDIEARTDDLQGQILEALSSIDGTIATEADTGGLSDEITSAIAESDGTIATTADTDGISDAIEQAVSTSDATVTVDADTGPAQEKVDGLATSAGTLGDQAGGAAGGLNDMAEASAAGGAAMSAMGIGTLGAAAGLGMVISSGVEAAGALERFNMIAGDNAEALRNIDVGGLTGDIGDLALKIGSSDEAMLNATASFALLGQSSGASSAQIEQASDNINALALRAVALDPSLGDAGAAADRLATALGRGGRALRPFNLELTKDEILAGAASIGLGEAAEAGDQFALSAGGAAAMARKLGDSIGPQFDAAARNAALRVKAMKEQFGEAAETIGMTMIPVIGELTDDVSALLQQFNNLNDLSLGDLKANVEDAALDLMFPELVAVREAWDNFNQDDTGSGFAAQLAEAGTAAGGLADAAGAVAAQQTQMQSAIANTVPTLSDMITQANAAGEAFGVMNAGSDPQVIMDNLSTALSAWDSFQNNIDILITDGLTDTAGALQQLGPDVAGGLAQALAEADTTTQANMESLVGGIKARGGDVGSAILGAASSGLGAVPDAVGAIAPDMAAAGAEAGGAAATGMETGLGTVRAEAAGTLAGNMYSVGVTGGIAALAGTVAAMATGIITNANTASSANTIGTLTGTMFDVGAISGIVSMAGSVSSMANSVIANAGSPSAAFSRGQAVGSSYAAGLVAGLAGQIGTVASTAAALRAAGQVESASAGPVAGLVAATAAPTSTTPTAGAATVTRAGPRDRRTSAGQQPIQLVVDRQVLAEVMVPAIRDFEGAVR